MSRTGRFQPPQHLIEDLVSVVKDIELIDMPANTRARRSLREQLLAQVSVLQQAANRLDPILRPTSLFDPSAPQTSGRIIALTTVAQPRHPLGAIRQFYGAGVYAIYYNGEFEPYSKLSGTEQPLYVGKADPRDPNAKDAIGQGTALFARLSEHAKNIGKARSTLDVKDFDCRFLLVQSGFQRSAEEYLINFFRPIWNNEMKICYGLGKHGDSAETRANKRSPWDTLHPGRAWADGLSEDQKSIDEIRQAIAAHLVEFPPYETVDVILDRFLMDLRQFADFQTAAQEQVEVEVSAPEDKLF